MDFYFPGDMAYITLFAIMYLLIAGSGLLIGILVWDHWSNTKFLSIPISTTAICMSVVSAHISVRSIESSKCVIAGNTFARCNLYATNADIWKLSITLFVGVVVFAALGRFIQYLFDRQADVR